VVFALAVLIALQGGATHQGVSPTSLIRADDYPVQALRNGEQGTVYYELTIGKDGRPKACRVAKSSASERLDRATCSILMKRARFRPARDASGNPTEDVYTGEISWRFQ